MDNIKCCYYIDFEFDGPTKKPLTLGIVDSNGHLFYVGFEENRHAVTDPWVAENVMPLVDKGPTPIEWLSTKEIQERLFVYFLPATMPHIVADWPSDISYFSELLITGPGTMIDLDSVSYVVSRVDSYPSNISEAVQHNALWDAIALRYMLTGRKNLVTVTGPLEDDPAPLEGMFLENGLPVIKTDDSDDFIDRLYRSNEICKLLTVSKNTLYRWIGTGYFPKPDGEFKGLVWREATFKAFLAKCVEDVNK